MAVPTVTVQVAFQEDPFGAITWTDVTSYVRALSVRRGKQRILDDMQPGTLTLTLDNSDGRFDPANSTSPYSPYVLPLRPVRAFATHSAVNYGLFRGFVDAWPLSYRAPNDGLVTLHATDAFKVWNLRDLTATYSQELSGTRIGNILDSVAWPAGDRDLDAGQTTVQNQTHTSENPLSVLRQVAATEEGLFFIDGDGNATFIDRHGLTLATLDTANYTFGDTGTEKPYRANTIVIAYDDTDLFNEIKVSSQGVAEQTATDATSQTKYLVRTYPGGDGLLHISEADQLDHARHLLHAFKEPALRIERIEPLGEHTNGDWARILDRDLGSKIRVNLDPPGSGDTITQDSFIEGIEVNVSDGGKRFEVQWDLVPLDRRAEFWILGDSTYGLLGTSTYMGW